MGNWLDSGWRFQEDPEVLRFLRSSGDWEIDDHDDRGETLRWLYDQIRSESTRKFREQLRNGSLQIKPTGCDPARWRPVEDRRQYAPEFYRRARGNQDEREIQAELRGTGECAALHGYQQTRQDIRCQVWYYSSTDRYSPDRCPHSPE